MLPDAEKRRDEDRVFIQVSAQVIRPYPVKLVFMDFIRPKIRRASSSELLLYEEVLSI